MISETLRELIVNIGGINPEDPRSIFTVRYRNKDTFVFAETGGEAIEAVARSMDFKVGTTPTGAVIAAMQSLGAPATPAIEKPATTAKEEKPLLSLSFPNGIPSDEDLNKLKREELQDACQYQKPPISFPPGLKKLELIGLLAARRDGKDVSKNEPAPAPVD